MSESFAASSFGLYPNSWAWPVEWVVTLGTQSLAEGLGIWKYFPAGSPARVSASGKVGFWMDLFQGGDETSFDANTAKVDLFQAGANEDEKQQYERFVVNKEACGNLFIAGLLSMPAWLVVILVGGSRDCHSGAGRGNERVPRLCISTGRAE
jgi:hypothetical protein